MIVDCWLGAIILAGLLAVNKLLTVVRASESHQSAAEEKLQREVVAHLIIYYLSRIRQPTTISMQNYCHNYIYLFPREMVYFGGDNKRHQNGGGGGILLRRGY